MIYMLHTDLYSQHILYEQDIQRTGFIRKDFRNIHSELRSSLGRGPKRVIGRLYKRLSARNTMESIISLIWMQKQSYERFENMIRFTKHAGNRWRPQKRNVETKNTKDAR